MVFSLTRQGPSSSGRESDSSESSVFLAFVVLLRRFQFVFLCAVAKSLSGGAQVPGRSGHVVIGALKGGLDDESIHVFQGHAAIEREREDFPVDATGRFLASYAQEYPQLLQARAGNLTTFPRTSPPPTKSDTWRPGQQLPVEELQ